MNRRPKYSIVTICKGRLHHLRRSLPAMLRQPLAEVVEDDLPPAWLKGGLADVPGEGCDCC